jgi:hypothetical protein
MVHLSKADEKTFDTFIQIEEPFLPASSLPRTDFLYRIGFPPGILRLLLIIIGCDVP